MKEKTNTVILSNNFVESYYKVSLIEKKLLMLGIFKFNKADITETKKGLTHFVSASQNELADLCALTNEDYRSIKNACKRLNEKVIVIENREKREFRTFSFVNETDYTNGQLEMGFNWQMVPHLNKLKERFTKYSLLDIKSFDSVYTIRFYELIKQYENIGNRVLKLDELKKMFTIQNKYKKYNHFKTIVINTAHKELKAKSDIYFEYRELKESRKVVAIELEIKYKNGKRPKPPKPAPPEAKSEVPAVPPSASVPLPDTYSPLAIELLRMFRDWHGNPDRFIEGIGDEDLIRDVMKRFPTTDKWGMVSEVAFFRGMVKDALIRKRADITRNIQGVRREYTQELFERREHYKKLNRDFKDDMIRFSEGRASSYEEQYLKSHYTYRQIDSLQIGEELIVLDDFLAWMEIY